MKIAVDVGEAAEVSDEVGAFDLPGVPDFVGGEVVFAAVAGVEEALDEVFVCDGFHGGGDSWCGTPCGAADWQRLGAGSATSRNAACTPSSCAVTWRFFAYHKPPGSG